MLRREFKPTSSSGECLNIQVLSKMFSLWWIGWGSVTSRSTPPSPPSQSQGFLWSFTCLWLYDCLQWCNRRLPLHRAEERRAKPMAAYSELHKFRTCSTRRLGKGSSLVSAFFIHLGCPQHHCAASLRVSVEEFPRWGSNMCFNSFWTSVYLLLREVVK